MEGNGREQTQTSISSREEEGERAAKRRRRTQLVVNLQDTRYPIVKKVLRESLGFRSWRDGGADWDLTWTDGAVAPQTLARMKPFQKINHFPGMFNLSRKNYLARHLVRMTRNFPQHYAFYPKTWVLPAEHNDLRQYLDAEPAATLIAKPQAGCQGRGIFLSRSIEDFPMGEHYVVQKYLKKPLLIEGLKFDLRVYVLLAGCDPLRIYVYREGLARFATEPYCPPKRENLGDLCMHLTNYAINKGSAKFQFNESADRPGTGHKRTLTAVLAQLQSLGHDSNAIWQQICELVTKTLISVQPVLAHHYRSCQPQNYSNNMCFQLLGFDIILDHDLRAVLLQVNYTPSFTTDTPLDTLVKEGLIRDALGLVNLTAKARQDTVSVKKREMMERTLTGKKVWLGREEREKLVESQRRRRDIWEDAHLGNFQKVFPEGKEVGSDYEAFLAHAQSCYLALTGGNIKRNDKVSLPQETPTPSKMTNTDQLERIYIKKPKSMLPSRRPFPKSNPSQLAEADKPDSRQGRAFNSIEKIQLGKVGTGARAESAKNGRGLSKIYNITFKEMKVGR